MRLKSYFVFSMEEAMQMAKVELGDEAMLVQSRRLVAPNGSRGRLEVIFAAAVAPPPPPRLPLPIQPVDRPPATVLSKVQFEQFRAELGALVQQLTREPDATRVGHLSPASNWLEMLQGRLRAAEIPMQKVDELLVLAKPILESALLKGSDAAGFPGVAEAILPCLSRSIRTEAQLPSVSSGPRIILLAGPAGVGKSTTLAKLAFQLGVARRKSVSVISVDNLRVGASDRLANLCSLLGVPFRQIDYTAALHGSISDNMHRQVVLIDTPGFCSQDQDYAEELAASLRPIERLERHIVLSASMRYSDLLRCQADYRSFEPTHLLFTRLDEAKHLGPLWAFSKDSGLPLSWVTFGPQIPDDIAEPDATRMAAAILGLKPYCHTLPAAVPTASAATAGAFRS